nr:MAG TPA: hypothetical protein [Myoviridae sp. ctEXz2]
MKKAPADPVTLIIDDVAVIMYSDGTRSGCWLPDI